MIVEQCKCKSVLCLDGILPFQFLKSCNLPIFAADGAANPLVAHGIIPKLIIGDLDSVKPEILQLIDAEYDLMAQNAEPEVIENQAGEIDNSDVEDPIDTDDDQLTLF